jgi:hypothetical protein
MLFQWTLHSCLQKTDWSLFCLYQEYILRISRVLIDPAHTRDIPGIYPGYPKENLLSAGKELGRRD